MKLATVFQISLYSLTALAGGMLAYGEESGLPASGTVFISILAFFFNERFRTVRLRTLWCNLLGLGALAAAGWEFFDDQLEARLLAGAHFLVYLTWIVLFQDKEIRQYWWLCALGLLQVAVGSVLTNSGWYGVLLIVYLLLALWTMSVFTLYQGGHRFGALESPSPRDATPGRMAVAHRAPAAKLADLFDPSQRPTTWTDSVQQDVPGRWFRPRFVAGVLGLSIAGLLLGLVLFLSVPRIWVGSGSTIFGRQNLPGTRATSGFSGEMRLGQLSRILENNDRVLQLRLYDQTSDQRISLEEFADRQGLAEPLFRGNALFRYENGRWMGRNGTEGIQNMHTYPREGTIRQEYTLDMPTSGVLFAMRPLSRGRVVGLGDRTEILEWHHETGELLGHGEGRDVVEYRVYSLPREARTRRDYDAGLLNQYPGYRQRYLKLPDSGVQELKALVDELVGAETQPGDEPRSRPRRVARLLEAHLRDSGRYSYSLSQTVVDPQVDPVEDFLFNRRSGHCEYFASALALMLRAAGIPSRVVMGFKGAELNRATGFYEVQQRHAHAWVEAFFDDEWIVLDGTPEAREESVRSIGARAGFWANARNSLSSLWSNYVVSMTSDRQRESFFDPIRETFSGSWLAVRETFQGLTDPLRGESGSRPGDDRVLTGESMAVVLIAVAVLVVSGQLVRRWRFGSQFARRPRGSWSWLRRWFAAVFGHSGQERSLVQFYEQFIALVLAAGFERRAPQTQWEFAKELESSLRGQLAAAGLDGFPSELTKSFYRVRFGQAELNVDEMAALEQDLSRFRDSLHGNGRNRRDGSTKPLAKSDLEK